ncbi:oxidoreductase molybdopterin-binding protein [Capsulimonas corticalis]|uniref:Oxidoreductase molybdopterin-binding protein n=1 Tax=Capsulimonas corticalis TaxID=2219043 RepID=A0A402D2Q6_9BACT|nr:molybdopterin-dependent oxidoreductase [Capsulimonas corticalis]BDI28432.1 oxidoreductase molybdopterin-binding protein [Capsulimonas corticalis]
MADDKAKEQGEHHKSRLAEEEPSPILVPRRRLQMQSRRDFLLYGVGAAAVAGGFWWLLPGDTHSRVLTPGQAARLDSLEARVGLTGGRKETLLGRTLTFDDDVAEALYSPNRIVPTYAKSQITPNLRNNYGGGTPDPDYIDDWTLTLDGLADGKQRKLSLHDLSTRFGHHEEITRLVCVEGWSAIAWWGGLRFADLLRAFPPMPGARWANMESAVNVDSDGNSDPYYVSIDLGTARHPQTLLATHQEGKPLGVEHGAPMRLIAPMKLGLKNIKALTHITYTVKEPADYWNERGYSKYDGV